MMDLYMRSQTLEAASTPASTSEQTKAVHGTERTKKQHGKAFLYVMAFAGTHRGHFLLYLLNRAEGHLPFYSFQKIFFGLYKVS
jgi:hypothetical protein